jgi:hypothetical protein
MKSSTKSWLAVLMGVVILAADVYWTWQSTYVLSWVVLGIIIAVADILWICLDYSLMKTG